MHHYSDDQPISVKEDDRFQRYEFAKRVANTITDRKSDSCIVIAIYGIWGDGKTSVLNFIEKELRLSDSIPVTFNPWRYRGEDELLSQFFETLARELKAELLTEKEKKGGRFKKVGTWLKAIKIPFIDIGDLLNNIGAALNSLGIEKLKERIGEILKNKQKRVVVFIDDIDRLNKEEIHAIFRLVKLNADFKNTTYVLSFDEEMVASAIGERFGKGNVEAGRDFLEKIIQVRLTLPKVQRDALKKFQFEQINRIIAENGFDINEQNAHRFIQEFDHLLLQLRTPRQAAQYANSISFAVPLLFGEVDISDLLLVEGIKIFYPKHYEFIKRSPEYFVGGYTNNVQGGKEEKIKRIKQYLVDLGKDLDEKAEKAIRELLIVLFPRLKEAFNNYSYSDSSYLQWYKAKQIASPYYFERYFSYCVIKGQLSDTSFDIFREELNTSNDSNLSQSIEELIVQSSDSAFIEKVRVYEDEYNWKESCALMRGVAYNGKLLLGRGKDTLRFSFETSRGRATMFIYALFKKSKSKTGTDNRFLVAKEILGIATPDEFKFEILQEIGTLIMDRMVFDFDEVRELHRYYRKMVIDKSGNEPLYKVLPNEFRKISEHWWEADKEDLTNYIERSLNDIDNNVMFLLKSFTSFLYSNTKPEGYYIDFTENDFFYFRRYFDIDLIKRKLLKLFTQHMIDEEEVVWFGHDPGQTDINLVRQFLLRINDSLEK